MEATLRNIRQRFFALRNGIVADVYRQAGAPYRTVFGLQIPQIGEIARDLGAGPEIKGELARRLWAEKDVRESRLLACWLFDPAMTDREEAKRLAAGCRTQEEADILCWRLLRRLDLEGLAEELEAEGSEGAGRCAAALRR